MKRIGKSIREKDYKREWGRSVIILKARTHRRRGSLEPNVVRRETMFSALRAFKFREGAYKPICSRRVVASMRPLSMRPMNWTRAWERLTLRDARPSKLQGGS